MLDGPPCTWPPLSSLWASSILSAIFLILAAKQRTLSLSHINVLPNSLCNWYTLFAGAYTLFSFFINSSIVAWVDTKIHFRASSDNLPLKKCARFFLGSSCRQHCLRFHAILNNSFLKVWSKLLDPVTILISGQKLEWNSLLFSKFSLSILRVLIKVLSKLKSSR